MIDTILLKLTLVPTRLRLAVMELLVKRLERIAVLYQRSQESDAKVNMPSIHSRALEALKSSISRDRAWIAQRTGAPPPVNTKTKSPDECSSGTLPVRLTEINQPAKRNSQTQERDKRKSRRKSYLK